MKKPLVSIIIPSFNSAEFIRQCLESVKNQTYKNIEFVVVDNFSKDETVKIAKEYMDKVYSKGPERGAQMNFGLKKARGKYIYRIDSDFVLEKDVVNQCVEKCEKENLDGIAVHNTSAEGLGFWSDVRKIERDTYRDDDLIVGVRFLSKKAWDKIGFFDEGMAGPEDFEFHNKFINAGFKFGRIKAIERHLGEFKSIKDIWKKFYYYGKSNYYYVKKYPSRATKQYIPFRPSYFRHIRDLTKNPILFGGFVVMNVVKYSAGGSGFLSAMINESLGKKFHPSGQNNE